jgi:hypothetical protein
VSNPIPVEGETDGKTVEIKLCGHKLYAVATVKNGKFEALMPTLPTGPFQLEAWVDGEMVAACKIDVRE